jgi:hypothetical protein
MCVVSMVLEYAKTNFPVPDYNWQTFNMLQDIVRRLELLDARMDQPECKDPVKAQYLDEVKAHLEEQDRRLEELEKAARIATASDLQDHYE